MAAKKSKIPLVLEVNATYAGRLGCDIPMAYPGAAKWVEEHLFDWADGIVVVSGPLRECVSQRVVNADKVLTLPNAINLKMLSRVDIDDQRRRIRSRYGITQGFVVGFVGSMRRWHGLDFLVSCIPDILSRVPDTHILLVGTGEMEAELRAFVSERSLSSQITITGAVRHEEVYPLVAAMDVGLSPDTPPYASPMKLLEYMALGAVPIAPDYPPIREIIDDRKTGLIFKPRDASQFTEAILLMANDVRFRNELSSAAKREVIERRNWVRNASEILELIDRVSSKRK